eukprot:g12093.t1
MSGDQPNLESMRAKLFLMHNRLHAKQVSPSAPSIGGSAGIADNTERSAPVAVRPAPVQEEVQSVADSSAGQAQVEEVFICHLCNIPRDDLAWVFCDDCQRWVHAVCDGLDAEKLAEMDKSDERYSCKSCRPVVKPTPKKRKGRGPRGRRANRTPSEPTKTPSAKASSDAGADEPMSAKKKTSRSSRTN